MGIQQTWRDEPPARPWRCIMQHRICKMVMVSLMVYYITIYDYVYIYIYGSIMVNIYIYIWYLYIWYIYIYRYLQHIHCYMVFTSEFGSVSWQGIWSSMERRRFGTASSTNWSASGVIQNIAGWEIHYNWVFKLNYCNGFPLPCLSTRGYSYHLHFHIPWIHGSFGLAFSW